MTDISQETQKEITRIRDMISTTKALLPEGKGNFIIYEILIAKAEKAIREQDTTTLIKILPELKSTH